MTVHYNYITLKDLVLINELSAIKFICIQLHASGTCADLEKKIQGGVCKGSLCLLGLGPRLFSVILACKFKEISIFQVFRPPSLLDPRLVIFDHITCTMIMLF